MKTAILLWFVAPLLAGLAALDHIRIIEHPVGFVLLLCSGIAQGVAIGGTVERHVAAKRARKRSF